MKPYIPLDKAKEFSEMFLKDGITTFLRKINDNFLTNELIENLNSIKISWRKMGFNRAGSAISYQNLIEMNINYLFSPDYEKFIKYTTLHELAHIINFHCGGHAHDKQWKRIAIILGDDGKRCHDYKYPENKPVRKPKQYKVKCDCGTLNVARYVYSHAYEYRCKVCRKRIEKVIQEN